MIIFIKLLRNTKFDLNHKNELLIKDILIINDNISLIKKFNNLVKTAYFGKY
jgi:hypothetical protein